MKGPLVSHIRWAVVTAAGIGLLGVAIGEDVLRRRADRRYQHEAGHRRQLEGHYREALVSHERLTQQLVQEQDASRQLSDALMAANAKVEEAVGRLTEENRTVRDLQARLAAMQQQMDQLQGELAMVLQRRDDAARGASTTQVELERILVSPDGASALQGRIVSVHPEWNFVVVSLGWDTVKIGEVLSIVRDEQVLAKARVERIQEGVCAATVLPEWAIADVQVNDVARTL
ncbi:MAG: hypothetical protein HY598_05265 [Candidatus Omnitrophica bacterium]|nr:hypothetical protein [Candidatus Omnitrophota bacterium]